MNAAELIAQLQNFSVQLPVLVEDYETGWDGIHDAEHGWRSAL